MIKRFMFELCLGIIALLAIIFFGNKGMIAFVLLSFLVLFCKKKPDEREMQLFYKIGNITSAVTIVFSVIIFQCSNYIVNGHRIGDLWLYWVLSIFLIGHGITGIIVNKMR